MGFGVAIYLFGQLSFLGQVCSLIATHAHSCLASSTFAARCEIRGHMFLRAIGASCFNGIGSEKPRVTAHLFD